MDISEVESWEERKDDEQNERTESKSEKEKF